MWTKVLIYMVLFYVVANPATFKIMRKALGTWVSSAEGLPTSAGLLLHSAVYVLLACYLPSKIASGYTDAPGMSATNPVAQAEVDAQKAKVAAELASARLAAADAYAKSLKSSMPQMADSAAQPAAQTAAQPAAVPTTSKYADEYEEYEEYAEY
jgi:hypothetical protein